MLFRGGPNHVVVCGDASRFTWRLDALYVKTYGVVCGDVYCCMWRRMLAYATSRGLGGRGSRALLRGANHVVLYNSLGVLFHITVKWSNL